MVRSSTRKGTTFRPSSGVPDVSERNKADRYRNNALALIDQGLVSLSSFLVTVFVGRFGSDEQLGLYTLGSTFLIAMVTLEESLIATPYIFLVSRQKDVRAFTGSSIAQVVSLGMVGTVALLIGSVAGFFGLLPGGLLPVLLVVAAIIPFHLMRQFIRRFFFSTLDLKGLLTFDVLACAVQVGLLGLWYWLDRLYGTTGHLSIGIAGLVATLIWVARYRGEFSVENSQAVADTKSNWDFAKYVGSAQFLWIMHIQLLIWFLTFFTRDRRCRTVRCLPGDHLVGESVCARHAEHCFASRCEGLRRRW